MGIELDVSREDPTGMIETGLCAPDGVESGFELTHGFALWGVGQIDLVSQYRNRRAEVFGIRQQFFDARDELMGHDYSVS